MAMLFTSHNLTRRHPESVSQKKKKRCGWNELSYCSWYAEVKGSKLPGLSATRLGTSTLIQSVEALTGFCGGKVTLQHVVNLFTGAPFFSFLSVSFSFLTFHLRPSTPYIFLYERSQYFCQHCLINQSHDPVADLLPWGLIAYFFEQQLEMAVESLAWGQTSSCSFDGWESSKILTFLIPSQK